MLKFLKRKNIFRILWRILDRESWKSDESYEQSSIKLRVSHNSCSLSKSLLVDFMQISQVTSAPPCICWYIIPLYFHLHLLFKLSLFFLRTSSCFVQVSFLTFLILFFFVCITKLVEKDRDLRISATLGKRGWTEWNLRTNSITILTNEFSKPFLGWDYSQENSVEKINFFINKKKI
mgnify:CR=1 FL=1